MTALQQTEVIVLALAFSAYVLFKVRVAQLDLRYALTWLTVVAGILAMAIFPGAVLWLAGVFGFAAGTNMLFIAAILVLAIIVFRQTMMISSMEKRLIDLTQSVALLRYEQEKQREPERPS